MSGVPSSAKWGKPRGYHTRRVWIVPTLWILLSVVMGVIISRADLRGWLPDVTTTLTPDIEVNDPTTAVMAMNEIADLVGRIGRRHLDVGYVEDAGGAIRLVYPTPKWGDFLSLAIDEIRFYGANSYQVMRRLHAMLADLEQIVPPERCAAIRQQISRAEQTVARTFADASDLLEAQQSDRQGIGLSRPDANQDAEQTA